MLIDLSSEILWDLIYRLTHLSRQRDGYVVFLTLCLWPMKLRQGKMAVSNFCITEQDTEEPKQSG